MIRAILVTGASKGIGRAAADQLSAQGWSVIGVARAKPDTFPGAFLEDDLANPAATQLLADTLSARGDVLGIVNNVGVAKGETFGAVDPSSFASVLDLNLRPALQLTQALLPAKPLNLGASSISPARGLPLRASYAAASAEQFCLRRARRDRIGGNPSRREFRSPLRKPACPLFDPAEPRS